MSNKRIDEPVSLAVGDIAAALTGIGILVMVLFPLAIPALVLAAALAAPFVVLVARSQSRPLSWSGRFSRSGGWRGAPPAVSVRDPADSGDLTGRLTSEDDG